MNAIDQADHPVKWIPVSDLSVIWILAQRDFNQKVADKIAAEFDPDYFGTITVTLPNGHGIYHVVDGQHRVAAIRGMWGETEQVPCVVVNAEDPKRAAQIFSRINAGRKKPTAVELFKVAVTAGGPAEVAINRMLTDMGYVVQSKSADGTVGAVGACLFIYNRCGIQILRKTFLIIQGVWGKEADSTDASFIRGIGAMLSEYRHIDEQRLVDVMTKKFTPYKLIGAARTFKEMMGGGVAENVTRVLIQSYNEKLRNGRLTDKAAE